MHGTTLRIAHVELSAMTHVLRRYKRPYLLRIRFGSGHEASRRALEDIAAKQGQKLYGSTLTLIEMCNTICRKIAKEGEWKLVDPLQS